MTSVVVLPTGTSNVASVTAAFERLGARVNIGAGARDVAAVERLVVPGVGVFGAARLGLREAGVWDALRERILARAPTMLVCLGMQLLSEGSEESPGLPGLAVIPGVARRLPASVRIPQLGWSLIEAGPSCRYLESGYAYFANSYALSAAPEGWSIARARHGVDYVAALESERVLACQFHPELSGEMGARVMRRWLDDAAVIGDGPARRVVPCLDVRDGRVVKGVRFADLRDAGLPAERAALYERQGADELVMLDVSATDEGRGAQLATVRDVRARVSIPLTVGGGVRSLDDVSRLLDAGADKVAMNTAAVLDPSLVSRVAARFGRQCTVVAIDAATRDAGDWEVVTHAGKRRTGRSAMGWAEEAAERGAGEILLTSFDRDGTCDGYDLRLVRAVSNAVSVPVIASGGAASAEHLAAALDAGADAVLAATIFHDGHTTVAAIKSELLRRGVKVRP